MFNNRSCLFKSVAIGLLSTLFVLTSCDSLLNGGIIKDEIDSAINLAKAETVEVLVQAKEGTGSPLPNGKYSAKVGYEFDISFTENPDYSFVGWTAVSKDDKKITEGVSFTDSKALSTKVKITSNIEGLKIIPECVKRIALSGEPTPRYEANGVSRDRTIVVQFTDNPSENSFLFTENEIPDGAEAVKNADEKIYAYKLNDQVYFKNISITNSDDISLAEHFLQPQLEGSLLTIAVNKSNPVKIDSGATYKTIKVTLSADITNTSGIKMNAEKSWRYQVTEETDEKASITISVEKDSLVQNSPKEYSIGQKINLNCVEDADWQFIKWEYDSSIVAVAEETEKNTTAIVLGKTDSGSIKAICKPRLRVSKFSPETNETTPSVERDSSITIKFNQKLPDGKDDKAQFENILISMSGASVKEFFTYVVNEDTITFIANKNEMLDVAENQTKTVTVTIPSDLYYLLDDNTKVYYGGNGASYSYKIDHTTSDKAEITFTATKDSGTVEPSGENNKYSIGQEIPLSFALKDGYIFNGWKITSGSQEVSSDKIKILDTTSTNTKIVIYEAVSAVVVKADCSKKLAVTAISPSEEKNPKDSNISITFNNALDESFANELDKISITMNGINIGTGYNRTLSDDRKTITLENTTLPDVTGTEEKVIAVTVPKSFYYKDGNNVVKLEDDYSFKITVNSKTTAKAKVSFSVVDAGTGYKNTAAGSLNVSDYEEYDIGQEISLKYTPDTDNKYLFNSWKITENGNAVDESKLKIENLTNAETKLVIKAKISEVSIKALCSEKLVVSSVTPYDSVNPKDSTIKISFNKNLDTAWSTKLDKIKVSINGTSVDSCFKTRYLDEKTITLENTSLLDVSGSEEKTVNITVPKEIAYTNGDYAISLAEDYTYEYKVNSKTNDKAKISFTVVDGETGDVVTDAGSINMSSNESFDIGKSVDLKMNIKSNYQFYGWKALVNNVDVSESKLTFDSKTAASTKLNLISACDNVTVKAVVYKRPTISAYTPNSDSTFPKDKEITLTFAHELKAGVEKYLQLAYSNGNIDKNTYFETSVTDGKKITLKSIKMLPISSATETVTVTVPHDKIYYLASDGETKITMGSEDFSWSYKIENSTVKKTTVRFQVEEGAASTGYKVNNINVSSNETKDFNMEQDVSLQYNLDSAHRFDGWKIAVEDADCTVEPSGYTKSGTIKVLKNEVVYITLSINEDNSTKATLKMNNSLSNSVEGYGVTVLGKDVLIPKVVNNSDVVSSGVNCDKTFVVEFNKAIDGSTLENWSSIYAKQIRNGMLYSVSVSSLFEQPVLSSDCKKITIKTKPEKVREMALSYGLFEVNFYLVSSVKDCDGYAIYDYYNKDLDIGNIVYNSEREGTAPVFNGSPEMYAGFGTGYGAIYYNNSSAEDYSKKLIRDDAFDSWTNKGSGYNGSYFPARDNHCQNRFKISDVSGIDTDTGVKKIKVTEVLYRNVDGTLAENPIVYETFVGEFTESSSSAGNFSLSEPVIYNFKTAQDGAIKIDLQLVDYAGNLSTKKTYYVIKDTELDMAQWGLGLYSDMPSTYDSSNTITRKLTVDGEAEVYGSNGTASFGVTFTSWSAIEKQAGYYAFYVEYGEDENSLTKKTSTIYYTSYNKSKAYSISVNPNVDTICDLYVYDSVGNKSSLRYKIPRKLKFIDKQTSGSYSYFYSEAFDSYNIHESMTTTPYYSFYYSILTENGDGGWSESTLYMLNKTSSASSNLRAYPYDEIYSASGTKYRIYVRPCYFYINNMDTSKYNKIYGNLSLLYDSTVTGGALPAVPDFTLTNYRKGELNSGNCYADLTLQNKEDNVEYYFIADTGGESAYTKLNFDNTNTVTVNLKSGYSNGEYNLFAKNSSGNTYGTSKTIDTKTVDLDTTSPTLVVATAVLKSENTRMNQFIYSYDGYYFMASNIYDAVGFSAEEVAGEYYNVDCYYGENMNSSFAEDILNGMYKDSHKLWPFNNLKAIELQDSYNDYRNMFNKGGYTYFNYGIPVVDIEDDTAMMLWLGKSDSAGNYTSGIKVNGAQIHTLKKVPAVSLDSKKLKVTIAPEDNEADRYSNYSVTIQNLDNTDGKWYGLAATSYFNKKSNGYYISTPVKTKDTLMSNAKVFEISDYTSYSGIFGSRNLSGKFVRVVVRADIDYTTGEDFKGDEAAFSYPSFLYIPDDTNFTDNTCSVKNLFANCNYVTVMSDRPCLVETIASNENRGTKLEDVNEWERRGYKVNTKIVELNASSTMKNYPLDTSEIETGDYYVVIAHFADGTAAISDVYQK